MPKLIKDGALVDDLWEIIAKDDELPKDKITAGKPLILPFELWQKHEDQLQANLQSKPNTNVGIWLDSDQSPELIATHCKKFAVIAINFPVFSDGRGYSYARQLREKYGYEGELRAIGDILRDQIFFYARCGFNAMALPDGSDAENAITGLTDFSVVYQTANDNASPAFLKR